MFRFDNPDAFLVLLLTCAAYATARAVEAGAGSEAARTRWMVAAGALVGFGFLAKMLQAFLVVPALAVVVLVAGPGPLGRRVRRLLWGGVALVVSAGWWVLAVVATPPSDRPYVGGSQTNSIFNLMFGYNGFGRLTGNETGSVVAGGAGGGAGAPGPWGSTGLTRLFGADMGSQVSWLLPAALALLVVGVALRAGAPRTDPVRAGLILWGGWLAVTGAAISFGRGIIHPYYTVALVPAVGALVGLGGWRLWARRRRWAARAGLAGVVAATAIWSAWLLDRTPSWMPWLRVVVLVAGAGAAGAVLAWSRAGAWLRAVAVAGALGAGLAGPAAYSLDTAATPHSGAIPTAGPVSLAGARGPGGRGGTGGGPGLGGRAGPGGGPFGTRFGPPVGSARPGRAGAGLRPPAGFGLGAAGGGGPVVGGGPGGGGRPGGGGGLLDASTPSAAVVSALESGSGGYTWMAATVGANQAAGYQLSTRLPVMAIGGFNGTDPTPTLARFEQLVAAGRIHWFIAGAGRGRGPGSSAEASAITTWVEGHFSATALGGTTLYDLSPPA